MTEPNLNLPEALADVRRAFRLLYAYQRRVSDLLQEVSSALDAQGFQFYWWESDLFRDVGQGRVPFFASKRWAWDMLPGYAPYCEWRTASGADQLRVQLVVRADTGFVSKQSEPDPEGFAPVGSSRTELQLYLCRASAVSPTPGSADAWERVWDAAWEIAEGKGDVRDGGDHRAEIGPGRFTFRYRAIDLAELVDATAVRSVLIEPLVAWATTG